MYVDPRFSEHFRNLRQVFLYVNDQCNLSCKQCIYKPQITYHNDREIPTETALDILEEFARLGATKLTILGGEPTLYGRRGSGNSLPTLIDGARALGYAYIRVDSNGLFPPTSLSTLGLDRIDDLAFSLDGYDSRTNDRLRGLGTFNKVSKQIKNAVGRGVPASITCCLQRELYEASDSGELGVVRVIRLGERLGVNTVNFHDLFKAGVPMDTWTGDYNPSPRRHSQVYDVVRALIDSGEFTINVRLPQGFVASEEFDRNPAFYGYCPVKLGERVMVHSEGTLRVCSNLICSSFGIGRWTHEAILWNDGAGNEMSRHDAERTTPCTNRSQNMTYDGMVPLCFSFKPGQVEPSWLSLEWDTKRTLPIRHSSSVE